MISVVRILWHYLRTRVAQRRFRTRAALERWQDRKVRRFLRRVTRRSRFYSEHFEGFDGADWRLFPTIDKTLLMERFDDLNTVGLTKDNAFKVAIEAEKTRDFSPAIGSMTIGLSSGTSGNRGLFIVAPHERDSWVGTVLAKVLPGSLFSSCRVALFLRANSNLYEATGRGKIKFDFYDLIEPLEKQVQGLNENPPDVLLGPPSLLRLLAAEVELGHLSIAPRKVISVAEVLDPLDEAFIGATFEQRVHQIYQCTEGFLAATCEHGTLHLNEDVVVVQKEYLDDEHRRFSPIVTDFRRMSEPIIRYRLNDILTERSQPCPCGSVFIAIESIEGRCDDVFYLRGTKKRDTTPIYPDFIRRAVVTSSDRILEYRVVQTSLSRMRVAIRSSEVDDDVIYGKVVDSLQGLFERLGCEQPQIDRTRDMGGKGLKKLRRVERCFSIG